jgi:hypothetical protein
MPLVLKTVTAARGSRWIGDAWRLFARRPLAFTAMSLVFSGAAMLVRLLPSIGAMLPLMAMPLLTLGFMIAGHSALLDGPVHARQFIEPLRGDAGRRHALLKLCVGYGVSMVLAVLLADTLSDHAWARLQALGTDATAAEIEAVQPQMFLAFVVFAVLGTGVSVPFWHAPALVHWGGQGAKQALFSSTLAVWRCKGAFTVYGLAWTGLLLAFSVLSALVLQLLGLQQWAGALVVPGVMVLSAIFYLSVLFTFNDSFGGGVSPPP